VPTLRIENMPQDLYEALCDQAKRNGRSVSAEVVSLLEIHVLTAAKLEQRLALLERTRRIRSHESPEPGPFPSGVEMLREDRER
jgi:plasmid stability protein